MNIFIFRIGNNNVIEWYFSLQCTSQRIFIQCEIIESEN